MTTMLLPQDHLRKCRAVVPIGSLALLFSLNPGPAAAAGTVGLGALLNTQDGGQIFGFDINPGGSDGVLATSTTETDGDRVSVETFDQNTGAITKSFSQEEGSADSYSVDGIFAGDIGLVTHYTVPPGQIYALRSYNVMNPVTAEAFTGSWTPPIDDVDVLQVAEDPATTTSVFFAIELMNQDQPDLLVSDIAANTFSKVVHLNPSQFGGADSPHLGRYTWANQAVIALSPDAGAVHGKAPENVLIDLATGNLTRFRGYNRGPYHAGFVDGLAVDPNTGIAATTTELNAEVEFYDLAKKKGIAAVQLPCTSDTSQYNSGSNIAVDPVNKLFLVTETHYCDGSQGSAIIVYDEAGNQVETITGFSFAIGEPAPAINPSKRIGWAFAGPAGFSQLQQFFY